MKDAIEVSGLKKSYGSNMVLRGLDFQIKQGEIFALLGVNGAGKTTTLEAIEVFQKAGVSFGPAKAANAGGVAVSALEMAQNSQRTAWSFEEVDAKLYDIMKGIYENAAAAAKEFGAEGDLVVGANIAGFLKVAEAMSAQGIV